jgi:uncharacterized protein YjiS (DUF1127 family)
MRSSAPSNTSSRFSPDDRIDAARLQLFRRYWGAFQERRKERRKRQRERAELYRLNDWELMDIGMTRGEIEYVVSNRSFDREESGPPVR